MTYQTAVKKLQKALSHLRRSFDWDRCTQAQVADLESAESIIKAAMRHMRAESKGYAA